MFIFSCFYLTLALAATVINATVDQPQSVADHQLTIGSSSLIGRTREERSLHDTKKKTEKKIKKKLKKIRKFSERSRCVRNAETKCVEQLMESTKKDTEFFFPVNETEIMTVCLRLQAHQFCIKSILIECSDNIYSRDVQTDYADLAPALRDLCPVGSPLSAQILKYGSCYESIDSYRIRCKDKYHSKVLSGIRRRECFAVKDFVGCYSKAASRNCTQNSTDVFESYYEKVILTALPFCESSAYSNTTPGLFILMLLFIAVSSH